MKPIIGITASPVGDDTLEGSSATFATTEAIYNHGGQPVIIPMSNHLVTVEELAEFLDGLLLPGGNDINPLYFNEDPHPGLGKVHPFRDALEIRLIHAMIQRNKPILGICRGCQILNVATGGNMVQDIASQIEAPIQHSQKSPRFHASHYVRIAPGSKLAAIAAQEELAVNSYHHQANRQVGPGFQVTAYASDGVVEAFESIGETFILGVQWHPEHMIPQDDASARMFQAFIEACKSVRG